MPTQLEFLNNEPPSPLGLKVPYWQWKSDILNFNEKEVCKFLLRTEKELIEKFPPSNDGGVNLPNALVARYKFFNFFKLKHKSIEVLQKFIKQNIKLFFKEFPRKFDTSNLSIICWYNVIRKWEKLHYHVHRPIEIAGESFISGHLTIACDKTSTHYYSICKNFHWEIKNVPGSLVIFPSYVPHETDVHLGPSPRIMIAFDIFFNDACGASPDVLKEGNVLPFKIN
jgi:hypothetical protein|tara:strand:- start:945 stop:1622 length:678 start_codon:yes stop_codon:yes gene_type:complete